MLRRDYEGQICSVARALEIVGERWTILILRDAFLGVHRFDDFQRTLGIARNTLASRLDRLVEEGILSRSAYQERPVRNEYRLTEKGLDLWPVITELMAWGDEHAPSPGGPPTVVEHRDCGGRMGRGRVCERCGAILGVRDVIAQPGPGAPPGHPLLRIRERERARAGIGAEDL